MAVWGGGGVGEGATRPCLFLGYSNSSIHNYFEFYSDFLRKTVMSLTCMCLERVMS